MTINYIFMLLDFALWLWLEFASVVIELFYKKEQEQPWLSKKQCGLI